MIKIIPPEQFETTVWKNGKGETLQLAISPGGNIDDFDWRLSIASVVDDGVFSDFSGYERSLILLEGGGIELTHNDSRVDVLKEPLSIANFSGNERTVGKLLGGVIKDFNVMTKTGEYEVCVDTYVKKQSLSLNPSTLCFVYSRNHATIIQAINGDVHLAENHLMQVLNKNGEISVEGCEFIVVYLMLNPTKSM